MRKKPALILSVFMTLVSLGAYYYLFVCADRKAVFLYEHLGFTPYDEITTGRYWMAGLVLSGFMTLMYLALQLIMKGMDFQVHFSWWPVVRFSFIPTITGVTLIMMCLGEPKLTFVMSLCSAMALITGVAIGFSVADDLVKDHRSTLIYLLSGLGLVPFLVLFRVLELPGKGILTISASVWIISITSVGGLIWLVLFMRLFKRNRPEPLNMIKGILAAGYIVLPVVHYLIATPKGFPYITSSDNFFADNITVRVSTWILLVLFVYLTDRTFKSSKT